VQNFAATVSSLTIEELISMSRHVVALISCFFIALTGCSKSEPPPTAVGVQQPPSPVATVPASQSGSATAASAESSKGKLNPCSLLTSDEIKAVQGEALKETKPSSRSDGGFIISQCFYTLPTFTNSISLLVAQRGDSAGARDPKDFWRETFSHAQEFEKDRERDKDKDKTAKGREEEGDKASPPEKVQAVGDDAYWTGNRVGGALYALKGNTYIRVSVGGAGDQATKIKKSKALAQSIVKRL
jgi:hypothetical protein